MNQATQRMGIDDQKIDDTCNSLQIVLTDLIDLSLQLKQAHWNVSGPRFRSVHLELDEAVDLVREKLDDVAERIVAMGRPADGSARIVVEGDGLEPYPQGQIRDDQTVRLISDRLDTFIARTRTALPSLAGRDAVSEDLIVGLLGEIEQAAWMFRVQAE